MGDVALTHSRRIRVLNDNFRATFLGGQVLVTPAVAELPLDVQAKAFLEVQKFTDFNPDNDPHGEHDFGGVDIDEERLFWKIDYYDLDLIGGSEDPSDPRKTRRILTIMFADEY